MRSLYPDGVSSGGLAFSAFARHYSRNRVCFLRLLSPRHPSCALCSLVISLPSSFNLLFEKTRVQRGSVVNRNSSPNRHIIAYLRICSFQRARPGGADRDRTDDIQLAKLALSQLSYGPSSTTERSMVGLGRFELPTPRLSSVCSNQLSYRPKPRPSAPGSQRTEQLRSVSQDQTASPRDCETAFDLVLLPAVAG